MLPDVFDKVCQCLNGAQVCRRLADAAQDPGLARQFVDLEQRWLALARGFQASESSAAIDCHPEPPNEPSLERKREAARLAARLSAIGLPAAVVHPHALDELVRRQAGQIARIAQNCRYPDVRAELEELARAAFAQLAELQWCPRCGGTMRLADHGGVAGRTEPCTYRCDRCGPVVTAPADGTRPNDDSSPAAGDELGLTTHGGRPH